MDQTARRYRERAAEKQRYADEMLPGVARDNVVAIIAEYEKMAAALDTVARADQAHPKHPTI